MRASDTSSLFNVEVYKPLFKQREDVELGRFGTVGTIHIRTDVETLQYLDVSFSLNFGSYYMR